MEGWYKKSISTYLLWPLSCLFVGLVRMRQMAYERGWMRIARFSVPVIVVGNLTVGGTGKTPLIIYLAHFLKDHGFFPGIVSRGYGGHSCDYPVPGSADTDPAIVGDEAVLLAQRTGCPVVVDPQRARAAAYLLAQTHCNIVLSDDGLQHSALGRDIEIVVVDGERRFGNGYCLPAGPLREPVSRLASVDFIVASHAADEGEYLLKLLPTHWVNLQDSAKTLAFKAFANTEVHAVAGIGYPERLFRSLEQAGITVHRHAFPDHYPFTEADFASFSGPVVMTEKDAVKCRAFAKPHWWYLHVEPSLSPSLGEKLLEKLTQSHEL